MEPGTAAFVIDQRSPANFMSREVYPGRAAATRSAAPVLSDEQRERIARNRQLALERQAEKQQNLHNAEQEQQAALEAQNAIWTWYSRTNSARWGWEYRRARHGQAFNPAWPCLVCARTLTV